jgi:glyoxylase I family protein
MKYVRFLSMSILILLAVFGLYSCGSQEKKSDEVMTSQEKPLHFEHLATNVAEPIKVANWYKDNLGMKIIRQGEAPTYTTFVADSAENMMFEFYHNESAELFNPSQYNPLSIHIAFISPDINKTKDVLVKAGAEIVDDVKKTDSGDQILMMRDPWGLPIQFIERAEPMLSASGLRFEHIAHNVKDSRAVEKWYVDNYGMIVVRESGAPNYGCFLADSAKNVMIELYQNDQVPVIDFSKVDFFSLHLASMSSDLAATKDKLVKAGATVAQDINKTPAGDEILVVRDPWGFPLQFVKRAEPMLKY